MDLVLAERQELVPQPAVFGVAGVQHGRLGQHGRLDIRVGRIVGQLADVPIEPGKLLDRVSSIGLRVEKMLVAVEDHAELGAPVADVVVADNLVAEEPQHPAERVADHGRADVADVHRLGHVRGGKVDHERARLLDRGNVEPRIGDRRRESPEEPIVFDPQIDEARPGDFRRVAEVGHVEPADDFGGHVARGRWSFLPSGMAMFA